MLNTTHPDVVPSKRAKEFPPGFGLWQPSAAFHGAKKATRILLTLAIIGCASRALAQTSDLVIENFEGSDYGAWKTTGTAFGSGPAHGTLPDQMDVDGFQGHGLVNSYHGGDDSTGTLTSPPFKIERKYLQFLIGGGGWEGKTCMNLLHDGKVVRTVTGPNTEPGGSEHLSLQQWDVSDLANQQVTLQIVDQATGGWGHINVDQIVQTDKAIPGSTIVKNAQRPLTIEKRYLNLPVKNGAPKRTLSLLVDGKPAREFKIELASSNPDWWAYMDVSEFQGKSVVLQADRLMSDSKSLTMIEPSDTIKDSINLYHEDLRPQFHFSPDRGWNNDPNGLVFYQGQYHLFFQHNPFGYEWDNMHWGHAVSRDLVHWKQQAEALYPDAMGMIYSGSAVVDWKNTSGFGKGSQPPLVLIYTSAGDKFSQCLAYSADGGKSFAKFDGNPVIPQITGGNRDPKVMWHEPTHRWVMVLWVEKEGRNTIQFLTSPNLKEWKVASQVDNFFECPDFFELPVDGKAANKKWVLTAASSEYEIGTFDGEKFTAETAKLPGVRSDAFYAAQTYSDIPESDGRRIQIGWLRAPSPGMPFNQCMSIPLELKLVSTPEGTRLSRLPVGELEQLRTKTSDLGSFTLKPDEANPLSDVSGELLELRADFKPEPNSEVDFNLRGLSVSYDTAHQELVVNGRRAPAPLVKGRQRLIIYVDRTASEVFADDGLTYVPIAFIPKSDNLNLSVQAGNGAVHFNSLKVYQLSSAWK